MLEDLEDGKISTLGQGLQGVGTGQSLLQKHFVNSRAPHIPEEKIYEVLGGQLDKGRISNAVPSFMTDLRQQRGPKGEAPVLHGDFMNQKNPAIATELSRQDIMRKYPKLHRLGRLSETQHMFNVSPLLSQYLQTKQVGEDDNQITGGLKGLQIGQAQNSPYIGLESWVQRGQLRDLRNQRQSTRLNRSGVYQGLQASLQSQLPQGIQGQLKQKKKELEQNPNRDMSTSRNLQQLQGHQSGQSSVYLLNNFLKSTALNDRLQKTPLRHLRTRPQLAGIQLQSQLAGGYGTRKGFNHIFNKHEE